MRLEFMRLQVEEFGSFRKVQQFTFKDYGPGLYFLRGRNEVMPRLESNGAGKSTLLNALSWGLYGKTTNDLGGPDMKPRGRKATTRVGVVWRDGEKQHSIVRTARPNSLKLNGVVVDQKAIDKALGIPFEVFKHTILSGQDEPLFLDLPNREQLAMLSEALGLERWDEYVRRASARASHFAHQHAVKEGKLAATLEHMKGALDRYKESKAHKEKWAAERESRLEEIGKKEWKAKRELEKVTRAVEAISIKHDGIDLEHTQVDDDLRKFQKKERDARFELHRCQARRDEYNRTREELEKQLAKLDKAKMCPTCGGVIKPKDLDKHKKGLARRIEELRDTAAKEVPKDLKKKVDKLAADVQRFEEMELALGKKLTQVDGERRLLIHQKSDATNAMRDIQRTREHWEQEENPYSAATQDARKAHQRYHVLSQELADEADRLQVREVRARYWVQGFKHLRLYILDEFLQELQLVANSMLEEVGLVGWSLNFAVERETKKGTTKSELTITVQTPEHAEPVKWKTWSGGERQRMRIIGTLALSQVLLGRAGIECNLEILDEPTARLTDGGVQELTEFLAARARQLGKQTWFVDHMSVESAHFSDVLTVVKTKAGSVLKTQPTD